MSQTIYKGKKLKTNDGRFEKMVTLFEFEIIWKMGNKNDKRWFLRGSILVFLVPIDIESSYTYQNLLIDSAFQALSNGVSIDISKSKKVGGVLGLCFEKN